VRAEFFYDIVCPYAYMASLRVDQTFDEVAWKPILLGGVFQAIGSPSVPADTWPEVRQQRVDEDLLREATRHGIELSKPADHPRRSVYAMRLILAAPIERRREVSARMFAAYWQEHLRIDDRAVVAQLALEMGLDPGCLDDPQVKALLKSESDLAAERGVFGVPTVFTERGMFWGADRLHLAAGLPPREWGAPVGRLRFFHDFSSPFSYFASTQIERVAAEVEWVPILLGALFKAIGTPMVPLHSFSASKQDYLRQDMGDWSRHWGVDFIFPSVFPVRTVLALRVSILEPRMIAPLYEAVWVRDLDVSMPEVVRGLLREQGLDEGLVEAASQGEVKMKLRTNTDEARALGVCGVPTCAVGDALVWGQDRLWTVRELL
jgi:2-hydroxychromene-2-carboxylate isomerase